VTSKVGGRITALALQPGSLQRGGSHYQEKFGPQQQAAPDSGWRFDGGPPASGSDSGRRFDGLDIQPQVRPLRPVQNAEITKSNAQHQPQLVKPGLSMETGRSAPQLISPQRKLQREVDRQVTEATQMTQTRAARQVIGLLAS